MQSIHASILLIVLLLASVLTRLWLSGRQLRHVSQHRHQVPEQFATRIALGSHQRAADYTVARARLHMIEIMVGAVLLLGWTLLGGLHLLALVWSDWANQLGLGPLTTSLALVASVGLLSMLAGLPFDWYRTFHLEQRFGFNRTSRRQFLRDLVTQGLLGMALGLPFLAAFLTLMERAGAHWWIWAWAFWMAFNLTLMVIYPIWIAPRFNRFDPLPEGALRSRVEHLLARCGFSSNGLFVMDGSRRSAHGNAFFTGFGRNKRIVFYDTLLERLNPDQIEAVLAHELGHFRHGHIRKRMLAGTAWSLLALWILATLSSQPGFLQGIGIAVPLDDPLRPVLTLIGFAMVLPLATFLLTPLFSAQSRRQEFEADRFAAEHARPEDLISALVALYQDNASTLTPDPVHSRFHDSHPPAALRIAALSRLSAQSVASSGRGLDRSVLDARQHPAGAS